jgi:glycosyltransferase involved in cell wall biosynthesis
MLPPHSVTACLVVRNEEKLIGRCLASLEGVADEIVIVHDGQCTDRTLDICRKYTAKIFVRPWAGVADVHRPFSFAQATGEWIMRLDADEFLSSQLRSSIKDLVRADGVDLYRFLWPYWDGVRRVTTKIDHPYKACLARRSVLYYYGLPEEPLRTYGCAKSVALELSHMPEYNNYTFRTFRRKTLPCARSMAREIWREPSEIACFGVRDASMLKAHLEAYRRRPLVRAPIAAVRQLGSQLYRGMWVVGFGGVKIALFAAAFQACIYLYIAKYRPSSQAPAIQ